jgi:NADH-quinone oxidoreductase subunit F
MIAGQGTTSDLQTLNEVAGNMTGRTICALADAAAIPIQSFLKHFYSEFERYIHAPN